MMSLRVLGTATAGSNRIRNGDILHIRIVKALGEGKWQVSYRGKLFIVASDLSLSAGGRLRTRAFYTENRLILRVLNPRAALESWLSHEQLPNDAVTQLVMASLRRSGMGLDPTLIRRMHAILSRHKNHSSSSARLLTILLDKGVVPTDRFLEELAFLLDRRHGDGLPQRKRRRQPPPAKKELIKKVHSVLTADPHNKHPLTLFNHLVAKHDNWLLIPFRIRQNDWEADGSIRINSAHAGSIRATCLTAVSDGIKWEFQVKDDGSGQKRLRIGCSDKKTLVSAQKAKHELSEKLRNLGVVYDDNDIDSEYDGFSDDSIDRNIDAFA